MKHLINLTTLAWALIVAASFSWNFYQKNQGILEIALIEARIAFQKDVVYRKWNAIQGGVYVKVTKKTPPNPYLTVPERDIKTTSGQFLTLINPAYMTRQVHELEELEKGVKSHITSLIPIRPENSADGWEASALQEFERGKTEISSLQIIEGEDYMRMMRPLITEKQCLRCHAVQGYKEGDIRGGISVAVPMAPLRAILSKQQIDLALGHGGLLLLGCIGIWIAKRREVERIKERNLSQEKLDRSRKHAEQIIEMALDAIIQMDESGNITSWNPQAELIFGWTVSEVIGKKMSDTIIPDNYRGAHLNGIKQYLQTRQSQILNKRIEITALHKNGKEFPIELTVIQIENKDLIIFSAFLRDITERKKAEEALIESEEKYRTVIENANDAIVILQGKEFKYFNPKTCELTGYSEKELYSKPFLEIIHPDDQKTIIDMYVRRQSGEIVDEILEFRVVGKHDKIILAEIKPVIINWKGEVATLGFLNDITERKQAEEKLKTSEETFRSIVESSPMGIHIYHLDSNKQLVFMGANPAANQILGVDNSQFIGKSIEDAFPRLIETEIPNRYRLAAEKGISWQTEQIDYQDDKINGAFEVHAFNMTPGTMAALFFDIRERKQAEQALKESEKRFRLLVENLFQGVYLKDLDGKFLFANQRFWTRWANSLEDLVGKTDYDIHPKAFAEKYRADDFQVIQTLKKAELDEEVELPNGHSGWVQSLKVPYFKDDGKIAGTLGMVWDITEKRKTEKALTKSESELKSFVEALPDVAFIIDEDSKFVKVMTSNKTRSALYVKYGVIEGKHVIDLYPNRQAKIIKKAIKKTIQQSKLQIFEYTLKINGEEKFFEGRTSPMDFNIKGNRTIVLLSRDISSKKKAENFLKNHQKLLADQVEERTQELNQSLKALKTTQKELIKSERLAALGNMVAGVAHEINTPLGISVTEASFLNDKTAEISELFNSEALTHLNFQKYLKVAFESSGSILKNLIRSAKLIKSFKQVAVDQTILEQRVFAIKEYINGVILSLRSELKRTKHKILINCPEELVIKSHPGAFAQITTNLIMNSLLHGFEGIDQGEIKFEIKLVKKQLLFHYQDNGIGMDEKNVKQIFDPFYTTKRNQGGTGLGMHIVYNLVTQKLNGDISCNSPLGKGVEFIIEIPLEIQ
jgi:PAS domain S-box-containing protein